MRVFAKSGHIAFEPARGSDDEQLLSEKRLLSADAERQHVGERHDVDDASPKAPTGSGIQNPAPAGLCDKMRLTLI